MTKSKDIVQNADLLKWIDIIRINVFYENKAMPFFRALCLVIVIIYGKSGCGKSTLLNILGAMDKQTKGDYFFIFLQEKFP